MMVIARKAAISAGKILLKYYRMKLEYSKKSDQSFVSIADREAEEEIKKIILRHYPGHAIYGEETGKTGEGKITWYIDPLDGTSNFKNRIPNFCVSIGIGDKGKFVQGVVYNPLTEELFYAEEGNGAFLNNKRITANQQSLNDGIACYDGTFRDYNTDIKLNSMKRLIQLCHRIRMRGSTALELADVARGQFVSAICDVPHVWDYAAGVVLVREAGGVVTDAFGGQVTPETPVIVAANSEENHRKLVEITREYYKDYKGSLGT